MSSVPLIRIRACNDAPLRAAGRCVLYWMIARRRPRPVAQAAPVPRFAEARAPFSRIAIDPSYAS